MLVAPSPKHFEAKLIHKIGSFFCLHLMPQKPNAGEVTRPSGDMNPSGFLGAKMEAEKKRSLKQPFVFCSKLRSKQVRLMIIQIKDSGETATPCTCIRVIMHSIHGCSPHSPIWFVCGQPRGEPPAPQPLLPRPLPTRTGAWISRPDG